MGTVGTYVFITACEMSNYSGQLAIDYSPFFKKKSNPCALLLWHAKMLKVKH